MKINEKNLCVFATSPPYCCEGFLCKKGEVNKSFLRRYFVLKGNLLFYFEKKGDKEPLGLIIVEGCTIELSEESDQYGFEIAFNGNRTYVLNADSQESMERWMKALTCAGYEYKKLMVAELQRKLDEIEGSREKMLVENQTNANSVPKPPPRRQNPFNRVAPPIPVMNGNSGNESSPLPFINGSALRLQTANAANSSSSPQQQAYHKCAKSEFYVHHPKTRTNVTQQQQQQENVQPPNGNLQNRYNNIVTANFKQQHEQLRQIIMKDILEYRAQKEAKTKPLIDL